jgi:hypothetical protein
MKTVLTCEGCNRALSVIGNMSGVATRKTRGRKRRVWSGEEACPKHDGALPYDDLLSVSIKQIGYGESDTVAKPSLDQPDSSRLARGIQKWFRQRYRREHEMSV